MSDMAHPVEDIVVIEGVPSCAKCRKPVVLPLTGTTVKHKAAK